VFDIGVAELAVVAVVLVAIAAWLTSRERWVRVAREWDVDLPPAAVDDELVTTFAPATRGRLRRAGPDGWTRSVSRTPAWAIVLGLLTLPLGVLLLLLVREHADLHLRVRPEGTGSRLRAVGRARSADAAALDSSMDRVAARLTDGRRAEAP
jgi:hypothetical protein